MRVIISGGGTGGHIFPAIAIAKEIQRRNPSAEILFVGAEGKMEMEKVPEAGFQIVGLPIAGLQRRLTWKNLLLPFKIVRSLWKARQVVKSFKPQIAIGVGGYASGPLLQMAGYLGVTTLIQEQNGFAGVTNKILGKKAGAICVAYSGMERFFPADKLVLTGNPVRPEIVNLYHTPQDQTTAKLALGLDATKPVLLVIGGSLGARTINQAIAAGADRLEQAGVQVLWQTGKTYWPVAEKAAKEKAWQLIRPQAFIKDMAQAYSAADCIISRSGAMSVSELCLVGKPAILVPSPNVAEDHQTANAMALVKEGAALLVKDAEAHESLVNAALNLLGNEVTQGQLARQMRQLAKPQATASIVNQIERLVQ